MTNLFTPLEEVKGAGRFLLKLKKLGLKTVKDLLWHFPARYVDFSETVKISDLKINQQATVSGAIQQVKLKRTWKRRIFILEALISDDTGSIKAIWFNARFLLPIIKKGKLINLAGKITEDSEGGLCLSHPIYEIINQQPTTNDQRQDTKHTARIVPIYPETKGLTSKGIRFLIKPILDNLEKLGEPLPLNILETHNFPEINSALKNIHFPENIKEARLAKKRFAFEDLFLLQLVNLIARLKLSRQKAHSFQVETDFSKNIFSKLPFELTYSQKKSLLEILQDLAKNQPMNRLLQGDVGSGKTIVAVVAALAVAKENRQSAFMAPTEILAKQHYLTFKKFFGDFSAGVGLITSGEAKIFYGDGLESEIKKSELIEKIAENEIKIIFGTHALIQKSVKFKDLALVIIDEQHRFGVKQRQALLRGTNAEQTQNNTETIKEQSDNKLLYEKLTYKIRGALFDVKKELGSGHKEVIYQKAVIEAFNKSGLKFSREAQIPIFYRNKKVGVYIPDFVVEDKIIIELKSLHFMGAIEKKQIWNYLKGSEYRVAFLVNYGPKELTIDRFIYDSNRFSASVPHDSAYVPHLLSMSATPIPRTLTLTIFGDLDLSIIDELPKGRKEIITKIVAPENRDKAYAFIRGQVKKGRQAFVICPRIETDNENLEFRIKNSELKTSRIKDWRSEIKAVKEEYEKLSQKVFPDLRVAMLHGKMPARGGSALGGKSKAEVMQDFKDGKTDILVSTSVIEVGVDIPNATIMMIEGADRFGLAQLYQFRGRVGRGEHQSFCFLFTESDSESTHQRLNSLIEAKNGFELAEKDLAIRGPGEFLGGASGWAQTGIPDLAMKAVQNPDLVKSARKDAENLLKEDSELKNYPLLKEKLEGFREDVHLE